MMEYSDTHIVILDTVVKKSDDKNNLLVEMYTNPQTPTITGIGQFLRECRNFSLLADYDKHSLMLKRNSC